MVIFDTSIIIDHLRWQKNVPSLLERIMHEHSQERFAYSIITIQELYSGKSSGDQDKEKELLATVAPLRELSYTRDIPQLAGQLMRDAKGKIPSFADAAIAATALHHQAALATLNQKDFVHISKLKLLKLP